jgi:hypothetical protein
VAPRSRASTPVAAIALVTAALALAAPARADEVVAEPIRPTVVAAHGDRLAWSELDPATGDHRLMTRIAGVTSAVPVTGRAVPFDVDLGPDAEGAVVAVYSRCRVEPRRGSPRIRAWRSGTPQWSTGRGCDLFAFSFATARETRLGTPSTAGASEFLPTIWRNRVAFARVYERRRGAAGRRVHLYSRMLDAGGSSRGLAEPPRGRGAVEPGPSSMDLRGRRVAVAWETFRRDEPISEIDLLSVAGGRRLVDRESSGEIQIVNLTSPALGRRSVLYGRGAFGDATSGELRRHRVGTARYERAPVTGDRTLLWTAVADRVHALLSTGSEAGCFAEALIDAGVVVRGPCELRRLDAPGWRPFEPRRLRLR